MEDHVFMRERCRFDVDGASFEMRSLKCACESCAPCKIGFTVFVGKGLERVRRELFGAIAMVMTLWIVM